MNDRVDIHNHSKGPWSFDIDEEQGVAEVNSSDWGSHTTVIVRMEHEEKNNIEGLSNALLISQAPTLLKDRDKFYKLYCDRVEEKEKLALQVTKLEKIIIKLLLGKKIK